jgi:tRNA dimethylallyltransferase
VYDYAKDVNQLLENTFKNNNLALLVGGTGLYVDAVCKGLDEIPEADEETREQLIQMEKEQGVEALAQLLKQKDPQGYERVAKENPQRVIRALEVVLTTGRSLYSFHTETKKPKSFTTIKIGLNLDREELYDRINKRVDEMMQQGFLEEAKSLISFKHKNALQTVGYKELFSYLNNDITLERAVELIKQNTRRYAKRQLTWFNRDKEITWFKPTDTQNIIAHIDQCLAHS